MALSVVQSAVVLSEESLVTAKTAFGPGASFTVGSGGNRALLFAIYAMDGGSSSATTAPTITATFNGAAVTILSGTYRYHSGDRVWQVMGYLPAPPSGAGTLSVTASSGQWSMWAVAAELTDAHQTTVPARLSSNTLTSGTSQTASGTTTVNGSMLFGAIGIGKRTGNPSTAITVTDGTSDGDGQTGTTDLKSLVAALAHKAVATAGASSVACSWTGSARFGWQTVEVFEQVASGGGQTTTADALTLTLTLGDARLNAGRTISAGALSLTMTLGDAALTTARTVTAGALTLSITLGDARLTAGRTLAAGALALTMTLGDASLSTGVTQPLAVDEPACDGLVYDCARQTTAQVRLTGKGTTGQQVQARGASTGGNTAWATTTVDGAGNWAVTFAVPEAQWGNWYKSEARLGPDDLTKVSTTGEWGCGDVFMVVGQSQPEQILNPSSVYSTGYAYPAQLAHNLTMVTQLTSGGAWTKRKITSYTLGQVNVAMAALANCLHYVKPGRKTMILDGCQSGTSIYHLASDAESTRTWADFAWPVDMVRASGSDVGAVLWLWQADDAGIAKTYCVETAPIFLGQRWGGGAFTLGTVNPDGTSGLTIDHCLWDAEAATSARGRGIFARDRTKLIILEFPPFNDASTTTEAVNFTSVGGRTGQLDRPARDQLRALHADPRMPTVAGIYGPAMHIADFGADVHPARDGAVWGVPQFGVQLAAPMLAWMGFGVNDPTIIAVEAGPSGAHADLVIDMPPNGVLTTIRALKSLAAPTVEPPHYMAAGMGYEIRRAADTDAQRRPLFKAGETSYPANYRGSVAVQDSGSGTWPARRARHRITPVNAFATGDMLEFGRGEAMAVLLEPRDTDAQTWLDLPIAHIPAMYDATQPYPFYGVPVRPQPATLTMTVTAGQTTTAEALTLTMTLGDTRLIAGRTLAAEALSLTITLGAAAIANGAVPASSRRWATPAESETIAGRFGEYRA